MHAEERELVTESLAKILQGQTSAGEQIRNRVREFGWSELLRLWPEDAVTTLFNLQGKHLPGTTLLDEVALAAFGLDQQSTATTTFVFPPVGTHQPISARVDRATGDLCLEPGGLIIVGAEDARRIAALVHVDGEPAVVVGVSPIPLPQSGHDGLEPDGAWRRLDEPLRIADAEVDATLAARWPQVVAACRRALAEELTGIARSMLDLALRYTKERRQFGRTMDSFQAVQHKLADVRVWLEIAELSIVAAWEDPTSWSATMAKIHAGRLSQVAAKNAQQVLGGMGFTWEHSFHRYLRRAWMLEPVLGSANLLRREAGQRLRADGNPPLLAQL